MDVLAATARIRRDVMESMRTMKDDFRRDLFDLFERFMLCKDGDASYGGRALAFFHMRRALSAVLDAQIANVSLVTCVNLQMCEDTERELLTVGNAYVNTQGRSTEDIQLIRRIFENVMRNFVAGSERIRAQHADEQRGNCSICHERPIAVVFLLCHHACCCDECLGHLRAHEDDHRKKCPFCRRSITGVSAFNKLNAHRSFSVTMCATLTWIS